NCYLHGAPRSGAAKSRGLELKNPPAAPPWPLRQLCSFQHSCEDARNAHRAPTRSGTAAGGSSPLPDTAPHRGGPPGPRSAEPHGARPRYRHGRRGAQRDEERQQTNLPIFKLKESCVRRRYSDFEWLKNELERDSKIVVPPLPGKALKRQLPFRGDEGIFEESFIEERRQGLEQFINKIAGHPLAQNERCLHMFLQEETIDRNYVPGKVRQ
uniref:Sorting nexin 12 n=1 Tax=Gallus gallus TaxID=9031 RepID=A0A8V0Z6M7_CHICK